jgi:hypothetical protein
LIAGAVPTARTAIQADAMRTVVLTTNTSQYELPATGLTDTWCTWVMPNGTSAHPYEITLASGAELNGQTNPVPLAPWRATRICQQSSGHYWTDPPSPLITPSKATIDDFPPGGMQLLSRANQGFLLLNDDTAAASTAGSLQFGYETEPTAAPWNTTGAFMEMTNRPAAGGLDYCDMTAHTFSNGGWAVSSYANQPDPTANLCGDTTGTYAGPLYATSPPGADDSTRVATTAWVRALTGLSRRARTTRTAPAPIPKRKARAAPAKKKPDPPVEKLDSGVIHLAAGTYPRHNCSLHNATTVEGLEQTDTVTLTPQQSLALWGNGALSFHAIPFAGRFFVEICNSSDTRDITSLSPLLLNWLAMR